MSSDTPSQKTKTPSVNGLGITKDVPYAAELQETSELIADNTLSSLRAGKMTGVEASGQFSLALLLKAISTGQMKLEAAYSLLKTLADKKTPNPAQTVEQHQIIDLQAMILTAVQKNPSALEDTVALAIASRQQIREKLDLPDSSLTLEPRSSMSGARPELQTLEPLKPSTPTTSVDPDDDCEVAMSSDLGEAVPGSAWSSDEAPGSHEPLAPPESLAITLRELPPSVAGVPKEGLQTLREMDWKPGDDPPEIQQLKRREV